MLKTKIVSILKQYYTTEYEETHVRTADSLIEMFTQWLVEHLPAGIAGAIKKWNEQ